MFSEQNAMWGYPIRRNQSRKMTDVPCFIIYLLLTFLLLGTFFYSFILEKEKNLFIPEDPDGRRCGDGEAKDYPFVYFPAPFIQTMHISVCVSQCPTDQNSKIDCLTNSLVKKCVYDVTDHFHRQNQFIVYQTEENSFLRLCKPDSKVLISSLNSQINTNSLFSNFESIYDARYIIIIVCPAVCLVLIMVYVLSLNCISQINWIVWIVFILSYMICVFVAIYMMLPQGKKIWRYMPVVGGIFMGILILVLFYFIYNRRSLHKSIKLLDFARIYIKAHPGLIFISLGSFIVWALIFSLELAIFIGIYSINEGVPSEKESNSFAFFTSIENNTFVNILLVLTIFHYIWTNLIIYHTSKYLTKALASNWVLRIQNPFKLALYSMLRFHTGSIIYGSIVLPFCEWLADFFFLIMPDKNKSLCCCKAEKLASCYQGDCFRNCLGVFTELTYIKVNLDGDNFFEGGQKITPLLVQNLVYINRAYRMATILVVASKILIAFLTTLICYIILEADPLLQGHVIINIIIFIFSLVLTSFATDSYDRSFQTILITILINEENRSQAIKEGNFASVALLDLIQAPDQRKVYHEILTWFKREKQGKNDEDENEDGDVQEEGNKNNEEDS